MANTKSSRAVSRAQDIIQRAIEHIPGRTKAVNGSVIMILCPFHQERTPSCMLNIADNERFKMGFFSCRGCGVSGGWNKLAQKLNLPQIEEKDLKKDRIGDKDIYEVRSQLLGTKDEEATEEEDDGIPSTTMDEVLKALSAGLPIPFPEDMKWRGQPGAFLNKIGAQLAFDWKTDDKVVVFPVRVNNTIVGGIKASWKKSIRENEPSYRNSHGQWTAKEGLFPFDYAMKLARRKKLRWLVLVEGPRDALRLLRKGIPAVSILGTQNWSKDKASILIDSDMKLLILMDGDKAGMKARRKIRKELKHYGNFAVFPLNEISEKINNNREKKKLKKISIDPGNMPIKYIREVKDIVYER